jgi:hypothetical protein
MCHITDMGLDAYHMKTMYVPPRAHRTLVMKTDFLYIGMVESL